MERVALAFAAAFIAVFVGLLWLVQSVFKARGWHELGTPERPILIRSRAVSRAVGMFVVLAGCWVSHWAWREARFARFHPLRLAAGGPLLIGIGAWMIIEGPVAPEGASAYPNPSILGWALMLAGLIAGLLYAEYLVTGRLPSFP